MENILLKYMVERFTLENEKVTGEQKNLPFVTISREYGCPAKDVASLFVTQINAINEKKRDFQPWMWISKEILQAASSELNVDASRIQKIFNDEKRGTIDEILNALSDKYYQSDRKILKTIDKVILDFAVKGNFVIVGRGGMSVTRHLKRGLHVRLFAPLDWRLDKLMQSGKYRTITEARNASKQADFKRNELLKSKSKSNYPYEDDFDVYYNCKYLNVEEIVTSVIELLRIKKLI